MIAFSYIDEKGTPTGGGIRRDLPSGAVALTPPWKTTDLPRLRYIDGQWQLRAEQVEDYIPTPEEAALAQAEELAAHLARGRQAAIDQINARIGRFRERHYTVLPGQDALYLEKRAEARAYIAEARTRGEPETLAAYPLMAGEAGVTAPDAWQLAQLWLNRADQLARLGAATERLRMQAQAALAAAPDIDAIDAIQTGLIEALAKLTP